MQRHFERQPNPRTPLWQYIALAAIVSVGIFVSVWFGLSVWAECRDAGFSRLYCVRMVTR